MAQTYAKTPTPSQLPKVTTGIAKTTPVPNPYTNGPGAVLGAGGAASNVPLPVPPYPGTASQGTGVGTGVARATSTVPTPPMPNAATDISGSNPALGYGGATYGTSKAANDAVTANAAYTSTDAGKASEIARTQAVIDARKAAGLDTSGQEKYLSINLGYTPPAKIETTLAPPVPEYKSSVNLYPQLTLDQITAAEAGKSAAAIQQRTTAANQAKAGIQTSYDRLNTNIGEDRALENNYNARNLSPFSGFSDFTQGMIEQQRGRTDRENQQNLQTQLSNIDVSLADFENATADQQQAMINQAIQTERAYGQQVDAQQYSQWADQRNYNYKAGQDQVQNNAQYGGTYNSQPTLAAQNQSFNQNLATNQYNLSAQNQSFNQNQQTQRNAVADQQWQADFNQRVKQDGIQAALSWANNSVSQQNANTNASQLDWSKSADNPQNKNANADRLFKAWQDTGKAPAGLESYGVHQGDPYKPYSPSSNSVDPKVSVDNANYFWSQIEGKSNLTKDQALAYAQKHASEMADTDYRALIAKINNNY
jgi:hypothetical protein